MLARPRDLPARLVFHGSQPPHLVRKLNLSSPLVSLGLTIPLFGSRPSAGTG
jgi:hypothetical protein